MTFISRRDLLKRVGIAAAAVGAAEGSANGAWAEHARQPSVTVGAELAPPAGDEQAGGRPRALQSFTAAEADLMDAIVARLIPTDEHGPGATDAHAVSYIDRALTGALASSRQAYTAGLAALDRYARSSRGAAFASLSAVDQDSVLIDVETGAATGFTGSSAVFFAMVLNHTHQGTFGDPFYGGNANFVGWDLLGYPGVRTMVTAADQKALESGQLKANHRSAYDYDSFTKASHDHEA
jgi:gluconate 2-dehydrogenase gamma chain